MPIETVCSGCGQRLRVGDEYAGRKARCPQCGTIYEVPSMDTGAPAGPALWEVLGPDGTVYGPVSQDELDGWVREGRVTARSQLRKKGEATWQDATVVYPTLQRAAATSPFAGAAPSTGSSGSENPYESPLTGATGQVPTYSRPHRGGTILTLGLLGILCCAILAPIAWVMGRGDIQAMDRGEMDPSGRGTTQAGMIMGIIGTVLLILSVVFQVIAAIMGVAAEAM